MAILYLLIPELHQVSTTHSDAHPISLRDSDRSDFGSHFTAGALGDPQRPERNHLAFRDCGFDLVSTFLALFVPQHSHGERFMPLIHTRLV